MPGPAPESQAPVPDHEKQFINGLYNAIANNELGTQLNGRPVEDRFPGRIEDPVEAEAVAHVAYDGIKQVLDIVDRRDHITSPVSATTGSGGVLPSSGGAKLVTKPSRVELNDGSGKTDVRSETYTYSSLKGTIEQANLDAQIEQSKLRTRQAVKEDIARRRQSA